MLVTKENILRLIPQRPPIVMVDGLLEHSAEVSLSRLFIAEDNIFVTDGFFQMPGLVENIAQTAALRMGYDHMIHMDPNAEPAKPPVGFIGEVKNLKIHFLPPVGSTVNTKVELLHNIFTASVIKGYVMLDGNIAAECEMKIFAQL
ncbi:MAG: hydroxymyristoyl-ACP dehydratase [Bacteroidetes bacterium]|nr:hydroxymyristoyl-ACP dehydratase [Bacteroidota bacterium]